MSVQVRLYEADEALRRVSWPDSAYGRYARAYLTPLLAHGSAHYVRNVRTRLLVAEVDGIPLPLTVNEAEYDNAYVCSPYTHYIRYARQELHAYVNRPLAAVLSPVLGGVGALLRLSGFDRVVQVNNWLLSTNLYPRLSLRQHAALLDVLRQTMPKHAIVCRSLTAALNPDAIRAVRDSGGLLVPSRQVYLLRTDREPLADAKARWLLKRDGALAAAHGYEPAGPGELTAADIPRIVELYELLYLDKYSHCNPAFTPAMIAAALQDGILELHGYRREGRLDAVLGFYERNSVMTTPLFGYDTQLPRELGLYRMLSERLIRLAQARGCLLHESSGAAQFKRNRGAVAELEYTGLCAAHLPLGRRLGWRALERLLGGIGVPLLRKYKL
ncbi:GNAT family N-acetyltransferase [Paenibacillus sp. IB182496]|uniref:GNAT family N-acetyltransferase n=1 Tax=Paenibacillus sabuli TaxID=2772509 RepID=A0A927BXM1_9BACL|nr:GNAT family N-acetyltransferase [Paenibacillus sabuli]MBD2847610.1 GNAT family N-acetyltransferase [Paenibacillus sabuli]